MPSDTLRSREVADAAGVNVETLRYYERRGLLRSPSRNQSGYRQYTADTVRVVRFVKRAQALGFTLEEVEELLALRRPRASRCAAVHRAATAKIKQIEDKIGSLSAIHAALEQLAAACTEDAAQIRCELIEALTESGEDTL